MKRAAATVGLLLVAAFAVLIVLAVLAGEWHWLGDVPTWIASGVVVFAAAQFAFDREERVSAHAVRLSCWLEIDTTGEKNSYGFVLDNRSDAPFHEVEVEVEIRGAKQPISRVFVVPPGRYFVGQKQDARFRWEFAVPYTIHEGLRPVMNSRGYAVKQVTFSDSRGQRWRSTDGGRPKRTRAARLQPEPSAAIQS
jgi:hypothetical protein